MHDPAPPVGLSSFSTRAIRARTWAHVLVAALIAVAAATQPSSRLVAAAAVEAIAVIAPFVRPTGRTPHLRTLLCVDTLIVLALWWLLGPVAGLGIVLFLVAALAGVVLEGRDAKIVVASALAAEGAQIPLHFLAERIGDLPLFHPPGQVVRPSEFLAGASIRLGALIVTAALFQRLGAAMRDYQRQLEELVRSKDEFIASISHELRTPLTAVVGFTHLLRDRHDLLDEEQTVQMITDIARESEEVSAIVEDLLVIARADIDRLTLLPEKVDVRDAVDEMVQATGTAATVQGESVSAELDPIRFRQILRNLITNSARYGGPSVRIVIAEGGSTFWVRVMDDGMGIASEETERVFSAYERAHESPTQPASAGLGLAVSRSLARAMGGDVVYRREAGWTVFEVELPVARKSRVVGDTLVRSLT